MVGDKKRLACSDLLAKQWLYLRKSKQSNVCCQVLATGAKHKQHFYIFFPQNSLNENTFKSRFINSLL